jgi:hypothetical protein
VSVRGFYHNASLVDGLPEGRQLIVTARGKPKFMLTKGVRPRMTRALAFLSFDVDQCVLAEAAGLPLVVLGGKGRKS